MEGLGASLGMCKQLFVGHFTAQNEMKSFYCREVLNSRSKANHNPPPGGGLLSYNSYTGLCRPTGSDSDLKRTISSLTITYHNMKLSYGRDPRTAVVRGRQRRRRKDGCQPTPGEEGGANLNL